MAYDRQAVERFLNDRSIDLRVKDAIKRRMDDVCDGRGFFSGGQLDQVMGDNELATAYRQAFETLSRYR